MTQDRNIAHKNSNFFKLSKWNFARISASILQNTVKISLTILKYDFYITTHFQLLLIGEGLRVMNYKGYVRIEEGIGGTYSTHAREEKCIRIFFSRKTWGEETRWKN